VTVAADPLTPAHLAARRRALGLSQQALGDVLGVPRNTVARWERGDLRVGRPEWIALALNNLEARLRGQPRSAASDESPAGDQAVHLPAELSRFVGREVEVAECCALLAHARLVTLTGPGGIGKSRLALKVARCAVDSFPNGVHAVDREDAGGTAISLRALSQFALEKGCLGRGWGYLAEALEIARVEGDCMALARTLETTACVLASQGPSQAAQIAGAASTLRARTGTIPWPTEQARIARWLDISRQKIGARAFDAAWALGAVFSESEAISAAHRFVVEALASPATKSEAPSIDGPLTTRQREVVALVARGMTNDQIAQELVISPATARAHLEHVLDRLDLHSRAQVAAWAVEQGLHSISTV
jgi:DNA-binding CsgD family transcriptional regulator/transcriptional regulator with XRE-family HTH domain